MYNNPSPGQEPSLKTNTANNDGTQLWRQQRTTLAGFWLLSCGQIHIFDSDRLPASNRLPFLKSTSNIWYSNRYSI